MIWVIAVLTLRQLLGKGRTVLMCLLALLPVLLAVVYRLGNEDTDRQEWVADVPGSSVDNVTFASPDFLVEVQTPGDLPPFKRLVSDLDGQVPNGFSNVCRTGVGEKGWGETKPAILADKLPEDQAVA